VPRNRAHGAVGQNRSCSIEWAEKQEKFQPQEMCSFLTSTFIRTNRDLVIHRHFFQHTYAIGLFLRPTATARELLVRLNQFQYSNRTMAATSLNP
jgi:hypothetical protein